MAKQKPKVEPPKIDQVAVERFEKNNRELLNKALMWTCQLCGTVTKGSPRDHVCPVREEPKVEEPVKVEDSKREAPAVAPYEVRISVGRSTEPYNYILFEEHILDGKVIYQEKLLEDDFDFVTGRLISEISKRIPITDPHKRCPHGQVSGNLCAKCGAPGPPVEAKVQ